VCRLLLLLLAVGVQSCRRHPVQKGLPDLLLVVAAALQARVSAAPRLLPAGPPGCLGCQSRRHLPGALLVGCLGAHSPTTLHARAPSAERRRLAGQARYCCYCCRCLALPACGQVRVQPGQACCAAVVARGRRMTLQRHCRWVSHTLHPGTVAACTAPAVMQAVCVLCMCCMCVMHVCASGDVREAAASGPGFLPFPPCCCVSVCTHDTEAGRAEVPYTVSEGRRSR
jgi:hypothetical protein